MPLTLRSKRSVVHNPNLAGRAGRYSQPNNDLPLNGAKTRSKRRQEQDHAERRTRIKLKVHTPPVTPLKEELLKLERATRGSNPTCLHFGIDTDARRARYPDYFFCSNCDRWAIDYIISENRNRMSRNSQAYRCKAQHTSFITPTTKIKQHFCLKRLNFDEASNDSRLDYDGYSNDSDDSEEGCDNVPSPSDLQHIAARELVIPAVTPETFGLNELHPQQLRYDGNSSSPNLMQTKQTPIQQKPTLIRCQPTSINHQPTLIR